MMAALAAVTLLFFGTAAAERAWIVCKPNDYVNVREKASKKSAVVGFLECGDTVETDGKRKNGFIRATGIGEAGSGWVYAGFVSSEPPEEVGERYVCTAKVRAACRRWIDGPRISGKAGWLYNGANVTVYYTTGKWAVTNRGYIQAEWLEEDPE